MSKPQFDKSQSLAIRLNGKVFWEQLSSFVCIDIILVLLLFIGSIFYMEKSASSLYDSMDELNGKTVNEMTDESTNPGEDTDVSYEDMSFGNYNISYNKDKPQSLTVIKSLQELMPENISSPYRSFSADSGEDEFAKKLNSIEYHIIIPARDSYYMDISVKTGVFYRYALIGMMVIAVAEIFMLIGTAIAMRKSIVKALAPLRELSQATQAFSHAASHPSGQYSQEALKNLARAMDTINVSHLDMRIPSDLMAEELKPLTAAINEMLNRINESYDSQIRFVSDASHELRTPIAVIQGYADLLSRWGTEDKNTLEESIHAIRSEAESMKQLVNQLLFLARGDTDSMKLDWKELNLSNLVSDVVKEFDMLDKIHDIKADITPDIKIEGDPGLIKQLLRILTDNSVKYTSNGGAITIKLMAEDQARITIQDEGIGIPAEILPHIFDRFVRADESRTRNTGGAGLGLSIGKWITEKHNGHLEVLSREGIGTRFTVVLPLVELRPVMVEN